MLNSDIAKALPNFVPVYADSAEPKSIDEIKRYGIRIKGVTKGKDSINYGIQIMQSQSYLITSTSTNLIKELRNYCWDSDAQGRSMNNPIGTDHLCDALRYHEMMALGIKSNYGNYDIR
jgi:phage terminase large subunit